MEKEKVSLLANNIRTLSADMIQKAKSGHPGMPLSGADFVSVLWCYFLKFNPKDTAWEGRDRFILSGGHGSALLYSLFYLFSFGLTLDDLKNFRQLDSRTPGHPEFGVTNGVEVTTGPLGMGFSNAVGLAISQKMKQARYGKSFDYNVFVVGGDGDMMEGISSEAASLAGHLKLGNLVFIYDDNNITIEGNTSLSFTEDTKKRFESYNWSVFECDGHDVESIFDALTKATQEKEKPSIIFAKTTIGKGSPNLQGTAKVHGAPLGEDEIKLIKKNFGFEDKEFFVKKEVIDFCNEIIESKNKDYEKWQKEFDEFKESKEYDEFLNQKEKKLSAQIKKELEKEIASLDNKATRELSGLTLQILSKHLRGLIGGSADLAPSNNTYLKDSTDVTPQDFSGKNLRFGVRENAMGAIINGFAYEKMWFPFCATFLVFSDYLRPAIRMAALSKIQTLFIFTHDSIAVGEDGATHQPVETITSLRAIPNLYVFRPADAIEVAFCYLAALSKKQSPSSLLFTRQKLPLIEKRKDFKNDEILRGAYVVRNEDVKDKLIIATGSEVSLALEVCKELEKENIFIRLVSMPCMELFLEQEEDFKENIIPSNAKTISIEMGSTLSWGKFTGKDGLSIGIDEFGASAPYADLLKKYGFTKENVIKKIKDNIL